MRSAAKARFRIPRSPRKVAAQHKRVARREGTRLEGGQIRAACFARIVVDDEHVDDRRDRLERGLQIAFARGSDAKDAGDGHR